MPTPRKSPTPAPRQPAKVGDPFLRDQEKRLLHMLKCGNGNRAPAENAPPDVGDECDRAQRERMQFESMAVPEHFRKVERIARTALLALKEGRYEICEACNGKIKRAALREEPTLRLCASCDKRERMAQRDPYPIGEMGVAR